MKYHRVAVLMGGISKEREISLKSGRAITQGLREAGYQVSDVVVDSDRLEVPPGIEAVFVAFHGTFGEDGTAQRQLEELGIPYTGSGPEASRVCFDKQLTQQALRRSGLPVPRHEFLDTPDSRTMPAPCVIKPLRQGSSVGIHVVRHEEDFAAAFADTLSFGAPVMVEEYIAGRELTAGIVDGQALPVIEIKAPEGNFDYKAKYSPGMTVYDVPADIPDGTRDRCQHLALETYRLFGCAGMSRVDFRLRADGELFILENNTIPGFTETSLLPKAARAAGISFAQLCDRIMQTAACGK